MSNIHHGFKVSFNSWWLSWSVANELWEQKRHEWPVRIWNDPARGAARSVKKRCRLMRRCVTRQFSPVCMNEPCLWSDAAHLLLVQRPIPEGGPYGRQRGAGLRSVTVPEGVDQASYRPLFSSRRHASWFPIVHAGDEKSISRHAPRGYRVGFV